MTIRRLGKGDIAMIPESTRADAVALPGLRAQSPKIGLPVIFLLRKHTLKSAVFAERFARWRQNAVA